MIPVSITLQNFMSYRAATTVDFTGIHMACLSGDNGAGKSALLDAMTWAVWGKARVSRDQQLIALNESQMEVTFVFRLGGQEYRVFRRRSARGATIEFETRSGADGDWTSLTGDNVRQTEAKITALLKMDYETFVNSAFLLQGKADTFTSKTPGDRKKVLADILNLADYDQLVVLARDDERNLRSRMAQQRERMAELERRLEHRPLIEEELLREADALVALAEQLLVTRTEHEQLSALVQSFSTLEDARTSATARRNRDAGRLAELNAQLGEDRRRAREAELLVARAPEIGAGMAELLRWRELAQQSAATLRRRRPLEEQRGAAQRAIDKQANDLQRELDRAMSGEEQLRSRIAQLGTQGLELARLRSESAAIQPRLAELEAAVVERRTLEQRKVELATENQRLRDDMEQIKRKLAQLEEGAGECPICRRSLAAGDHAHIEDLWRADGKQLGDRYRTNRAELDRIDADLPALTQHMATLEEVRDAESRRIGLIQLLAAEQATGAELMQSAEQAAAETARLTAIQAGGRFAESERAALTSTETALAALSYDAAQHQQAETQAAELAHFDDERQALEAAQLRVETLTERITAAVQQSAALQQEIDTLTLEITGYDQQLTGADEARRRLAVLNVELRDQETRHAQCQGRVATLKEQLAQLDQLAEERRALNQQVAQVALDADALKELSGAFGRNGIQALIIDTVLPELSDEANTLLRRMSTGAMQIEMHTQRELQTRDAVAETLDIIIRDEYGVRSYDLYSGGEAFRINFAIRVALAKLLARRAGATIDMLVVDEGFGTQDSQGRDGIVEALQSIADDFASIIVITHIDELRDLFPTRIEVVKTADGSRVSVS